MIVVGGPTENNGDIFIHLDKDDYITALVSMGTDNVISGDTYYYEKIDKERFILVRSIKFKHLNIQIGQFDKVFHGTSQWQNNLRGVLSFSLQKDLLNHFETFGMTYYSQYALVNYSSGDFTAMS